MGLCSARMLLLAASACGRLGFGEGTAVDGGPVDPTLIAWYPLDDNPGTLTYRDASGHGRSSSCAAACPTTSPGPHGGTAGRFDGMGQCLEIVPAIDLDPPYSITLWLRPERVSPFFDNLVGRAYGPANEDTYALDLYQDGTIEFFTPIQQHLRGATAPAISSWVHVAATYDGAMKKLYIGGVLDGSDPFSGAIPADSHSTYIGCDWDTDALAGFLQGSLADVRFYARVLSDEEIAAQAIP